MLPLPTTRLLLVLGMFLLLPVSLLASHIRAGQITAERAPGSTNPLTYKFTLVLYRDKTGVDQENAALDMGVNAGGLGNVILTADLIDRRDLGGFALTEVLTYEFVYTYPATGTYTVSFTEENRNYEVVNMTNSGNTPFHIETSFTISPTLGLNNSVVLRNPPIDRATVGQKFCHNPAAFDPDGDSLSFRLVVPFQKTGTAVLGYLDPSQVTPLGTPESGSGAPTFTIDPVTGDICWDAPGPRRRGGGVIAGPGDFAEYNIAFVVEEWRKTTGSTPVKVGTVRRDMQIRVEFNPNRRPELIIPNDTCIVAGSPLEKLILATDPDRHQVSIGSESAIFSRDPRVFPNQPPATLTPPATIKDPVFQDSPAQSTFAWQTDCGHVRAQPYAVVFRAEDNPPNINQRLTDTKTWLIRVVGPKPTGLKAASSGKTMRLTWDPYSCPNASQIIIWRKVGCEKDSIDPCQTGAPAGYVEVGRVPANSFSFVDNNNGQGLETGVEYSYRIGATFAPPGGGESAPSDAVCARLLLEVPLITNVSVLSTDPATGQILVRWTQPLEIDQKQFPGPYRYELYRAEGLSGNAFPAAPVLSRTFDGISPSNDTTFTDTGLNTQDLPYRYVIRFYTGGSTFKDSSKVASSVRLSARPLPRAIELSWQANVPWNNANQTHRLYRIQNNNEASPVFLAEVPVTAQGSFRYVDQGLSEDSVYCYKVETFGVYNSVPIEQPLRNFSQRICSTPLDTIRPCPPVLTIDGTECDKWEADPASFCNQDSFTNRLDWTYPEELDGQKCDKDVVKYRIYYSRYQGEGEQFVLLDSVVAQQPMPASFYLHENLPHYAGCYYITAVDRSGNESAPSNTVCKDNCPYYVLPNVITPNGDNKNDVLQPFPCPRFVQSVSFDVYNRWGRKVFETSDDILIKWNGKLGRGSDTSSEELSPGVYYYGAEVRFFRLRRADELVKIKGWVHILK